jgi:hypothetical protein
VAGCVALAAGDSSLSSAGSRQAMPRPVAQQASGERRRRARRPGRLQASPPLPTLRRRAPRTAAQRPRGRGPRSRQALHRAFRAWARLSHLHPVCDPVQAMPTVPPSKRAFRRKQQVTPVQEEPLDPSCVWAPPGPTNSSDLWLAGASTEKRTTGRLERQPAHGVSPWSERRG